MALMPKTMLVGPFTYSLIEDDGPIILNQRTCTGLQSSEDQKIQILSGRALQNRQQTLTHEILHAIHHYREFEPTKNDGETNSFEFGRGFLLVAKQNPEVMKWLMQDSDEDVELPKIEQMPEKIKIGIYVYSLLAQENIIHKKFEVVGCVDFDNQVIKFSPNRGPQMIQSTLMFHIFESIFDYRNLIVENKDTELIVEEAAFGILLFIKQNPEFMSWIINN